VAHIIDVQRANGRDDASRFRVTVSDDSGRTEHDVTVSLSDLERLGGNFRSLDEFVRASFEFLLAREPKESILPSFDVAEISRYFPRFEEEMARARPY
jgi:hypothetical protein